MSERTTGPRAAEPRADRRQERACRRDVPHGEVPS
ncbi:hypothetical protein FHX75_12238 [Micromonospora palomenae]|uniref:Uncharacterized protein n=1 Tax=Micromonospora palomenae TaxID=1461247 RepID=A0A561WD03_9ACTN|nr:hypothetical protein FHX75_12238 [Micromonospora palomenae]